MMKPNNRIERRARAHGRRRSIELGLEQCEERFLLSISVTTVQDNGSNSNPTPGSLRAAIIQANNTPNSTIDFAFSSGTSPFVINVNTNPLPSIVQPTTIDGTTDPVVEINGLGQTFDGLTLANGSGGSAITGLTVSNFKGAGIHVQSSGDTIKNDILGGARPERMSSASWSTMPRARRSAGRRRAPGT